MKKTKNHNPGKKISSSKSEKGGNKFQSSFLCTLFFILCASTVMYFHEMWRDEYQSWQIACASGSFLDLFHNIRYEGHPCGWFIILFSGSKMSTNPVVMQVIHLAIASCTVYLIFRYSPFFNSEKWLIVFGYFFLYEYGVISRNYALSVLIIILICISSGKLQTKAWITGLLLFALCQVNLYAGILAVILCFYFIRLSFEKKQSFLKLTFLLLPAFAGFAWMYFQVSPTWHLQNNSYYRWSGGFSMDRIFTIGEEFFNVYFPVPLLSVDNSFNKNLFVIPAALKTVLAGVIFIYISYRLRKNKPLVLLYCGGTLLLSAALYNNLHTMLRHEGILFILLLVVIWIIKQTYSQKNQSELKLQRIFYFILVFQFAGGIIAAGKDCIYKFSNLNDAGFYAQSHRYDTLSVAGMVDYMTAPVSLFIKKPVFTAENGREIRFITWNDERQEGDSNLIRLFQRTDSLLQNGVPKAVLIFSQPITGTDMIRLPIGDSSIMYPVSRFDKPCITGDEKYYIYEAIKQIK